MHRLITLFCLFMVAILSTSHASPLNNRPIIGILAQPYHDSERQLRMKGPMASEEKHTYIAASYVKYLEASGARVVPLPYDLPAPALKSLLTKLNGVLFPGGGTSLANTTYLQVHRDIMEYSIEESRNGRFFPLWATCLGFEAVVIVTASNGYYSMYNNLDSWNISMPLRFDDMKAAKESRLFADMPADLFDAIQAEPLTMNNHHSGFLTPEFVKDSQLTSFWSILSVNEDRKGLEFISTIEAKNFPIYATQWHPEKNAFEWTAREGIVHTENAIRVTQYFSNYFVNQARKSAQRFDSIDDENKVLIYNFNPEFTYLDGSDFQQCYFFPKQQ